MATLRDILKLELPSLPAGLLRTHELDTKITNVYLANGAPCSTHAQVFREWPGPSNNVSRWFLLENGMAIGLEGECDQPVAVARFPLNKIRYLDWNRLRTCRLVHQAGSFTKAGQILDITQSAVSRQVAAVERELGCDLFIRSSSGLILTEVGEYFMDTINHMWETLDLGLARINEIRDAPQGPLRLTTTEAFGAAWLSSRITRFHQQYPDIEVSLLLIDNAELDLTQRDADCAIRFRHPTDPRLVRRFIADFSYHIYASQDYLKERGVPKTLDDLENHSLIVYGDGFGDSPVEDINWLLTVGLPEGTSRTADLRVNNIYGIYRAVEAGMGLAALPFYMSERSDSLVKVLPEVAGPPIPVFFVYREELRSSRRIAALREFILSEVRAGWVRKG